MTASSKKNDPWIRAKKKYRLSAERIAMAKELGLNPKNSAVWPIIIKSLGKHR